LQNETVKILTKSDIKVLNLKKNLSDDKQAIRQVAQSLAKWGFLVFSRHGIDMNLLDKCYQQAKLFFNLSLDDKLTLHHKNIVRKSYISAGYFPYKTETAVNNHLADLKEFFHIGPNITNNHPMRDYYTHNVWPSHLPEFEHSFTLLQGQFEQCGTNIMSTIAKTYNLPLSDLHALIEHGANITRAIHYPPVNTDELALRAAPHTGINLIGLCPRTTHPGLQFYTPSGEWIALDESFRDYLVINIGEMLAYILNNSVKPTLHRVVNTQGNAHEKHRYCIVHFFHTNLTKKLFRIDKSSIVTDSLNSGKWLLQRLDELGYNN